MRRALVLACFVFALSACGRQRVVTQPDLPPLAPPPPPARVVTPPEPQEQPPTPAPEPDRKAPRRTPPKAEPPQAAPPKPEPAKPVAPVPPRDESQPPTTLQTTPPAAQADMERQARGLIVQARRDLDQVKRGLLNPDGRGQYDAARRFVEQAEQALKEQNFVLAKSLADKAATIAAVLVGK